VASGGGAFLAQAGHGGFTVIGLNALVLGAGGALARPLYAALARRVAPPAAMTAATALTQTVSGALWLAVMVGALRALGTGPDRMRLAAGVAFPLWLAGILVESAVAFGVARFLVRVRPDLLPGGQPEREGGS
jgi:ABC-type Co2+ transport system permease subunit